MLYDICIVHHDPWVRIYKSMPSKRVSWRIWSHIWIWSHITCLLTITFDVWSISILYEIFLSTHVYIYNVYMYDFVDQITGYLLACSHIYMCVQNIFLVFKFVYDICTVYAARVLYVYMSTCKCIYKCIFCTCLRYFIYFAFTCRFSVCTCTWHSYVSILCTQSRLSICQMPVLFWFWVSRTSSVCRLSLSLYLSVSLSLPLSRPLSLSLSRSLFLALSLSFSISRSLSLFLSVSPSLSFSLVLSFSRSLFLSPPDTQPVI